MCALLQAGAPRVTQLRSYERLGAASARTRTARHPQCRANPNARYQFDVVEANVLAHLPWLTEGGIDL
jgi:hypothetical protein